MADTDPSDRSDSPFKIPRDEDDFMQRVVLLFVLERHPDSLTVAELVTKFCKAPDSFKEADAVERAARDLVGDGLFRRQGEALVPTHPALRFFRLDRD
jgi:hypothetical protein